MSNPVHKRPSLAVAALALLLSSAAFAQEETTANILGRHIGATTEAVSEFGKLSGTLVHISSSTFSGTGRQRRDMARRVERAFDPWRNASAATRASLGLTVATRALTVTDYATSIFAPGLEGDVRGAVSGAVQIAVAPTVIASGTAIFGSIGAGTGAFVGSVIPVIGTTLGGVVGGAIGKVAGGYLSAFAYDKWIKTWVGEGVEAGIAGVLDRGALQDAMRSRDQYFYDKSIPEMRVVWDDMRSKGIGFGNEQVELLGPDQTPYIAVPEEPVVAPPPDDTPMVSEEPLAPPPDEVGDGLLAGATTLTLNRLRGSFRNAPMMPWMVCTLDDEQVECSSPDDTRHTLSGALTGNIIDAQASGAGEIDFGGDGYTYESAGHVTIVLEPGGKATVSESGYVTVLTQWGNTDWGAGWPYDYSNLAGEWLPY